MSDKTGAQKLMIKEGRRVLFVNAPKGFKALLGELPPGVQVLKRTGSAADVIQLFVDSRKDLGEQLPRLKGALAPGGMLWVTYLKGTSKIKTDINRDSINEYARMIGMQGVAMISLDDDWSALRLKVV